MAILTDGSNNIRIYRTGATVDDDMANNNTWFIDGSSDQTYTGTWDTGAFAGAYFNSRFSYAKDHAINYTDTGQPWDLAGGSFKDSRGKALAMTTMTPELQDKLSTSLLYVWSTAGLEVIGDRLGVGLTPFESHLPLVVGYMQK